VIKISLLVMLGLAATVLLRKRSAALRHCVLAAAIACAAATPVLELVVPAWHLPVGSSLFGRVEPLALFIPISELPSHERSLVVQEEGTRPIQRAAALRLLTPIWMAGIGIGLAIFLVGFARLAWLASRSQPLLRGRWSDLADALSREYGLRRPVLLLQSDHPTLLVTWGLRQPKVILPRAARHWPADRIRIVLGHELAHIRRRDWVVQMAAELLRSVYWFNPLLWIACRQLRRESEHACDDAVLNLGIEGPDYAAHLLDLARTFKQYRRTFVPAPAMARPSSLERRVVAMLNARLNRTPITRPAGLAIAVALLTITLPIAGLVVSAQNGAAAFSGSLMDAIGRIMPDTALVLSSAASQQKHETRSDQTGHFAFAGLPAGEYRLEVSRPGFATTQGRVILGAGQNLMQDVALQVGSLQEIINVSDPIGAPDVATAVTPPRTFSHVPDYDPCSQSTVGGCIQQPTKLSDTRALYPASLHGSGLSETVLLEARIGTDGLVNDLRVLDAAHADFATAAVEAVRQWQFTQTRLDSVPIEVRMKVTVTFTGRQKTNREPRSGPPRQAAAGLGELSFLLPGQFRN
jgi:TonB family protein